MLPPTPAHDLRIYYEPVGRPYLAKGDGASSVFRDPDDPDGYFGPENVIDGDPKTAWAEGGRQSRLSSMPIPAGRQWV